MQAETHATYGQQQATSPGLPTSPTPTPTPTPSTVCAQTPPPSDEIHARLAQLSESSRAILASNASILLLIQEQQTSTAPTVEQAIPSTTTTATTATQTDPSPPPPSDAVVAAAFVFVQRFHALQKMVEEICAGGPL